MSIDNPTPAGHLQSGRPASLGEQYHPHRGCHWLGRPHLGPCRDRSNEAGNALSLIRAVLTRASNAKAQLLDSRDGTPLEWHRLPQPKQPDGQASCLPPPPDTSRPPFHDPDLDVMIEVLLQVVGLLEPWKRDGRTTHWVRPEDRPARLVPVADVAHLYDDEVGDEAIMGRQAVLAEVRRRLAAQFGWNGTLFRLSTGVVDEYMREIVDEARDGEEGDNGDDD